MSTQNMEPNVLEDAFNELKFCVEGGETSPEAIQETLNTIADNIASGGPEVRKEIVDDYGYYYITEAWKLYCHSEQEDPDIPIVLSPEAVGVRESCIKALYTLTAGYPEIIDNSVYVMLSQAFSHDTSESTKIFALKLMRNICIKSERNRERIVDFGLVGPFVGLIKIESVSAAIVREWCGALRAFILNDDRRFSYNRSAERKRLVYYEDVHPWLSHFMAVYLDLPTENAITNVLSLMVSNQDFCLAFEASHGLRGLQHVIENYNFNPRLMKNVVVCVRNLNMCPALREKCAIHSPLLKIILNLAWSLRSDPDLVELTFSCLSFMTLSCPTSCDILLADNGIQSVALLMKIYKENKFIAKNGCSLLRNLAKFGGETAKTSMIEKGLEPILHQIAAIHPQILSSHINPIVKELGWKLINDEKTSSSDEENSQGGGSESEQTKEQQSTSRKPEPEL